MFGWIKKRIINASTDAVKDDLERFIRTLQGADDEEIATMLIVATMVRLKFIHKGVIPHAALDLGIYRHEKIEIQCDMCPIHLVRAIKQFQKVNQPVNALGVMIWLHSVRALNIPEIRILGKLMWRELSRGMQFLGPSYELDGALALDLIQTLGTTSLPENLGEEFSFIPYGLEP